MRSSMFKHISKIPAGQVAVPVKLLFDGHNDSKEVIECPDWSYFLIHENGTKIVWDLGLLKDLEQYPPSILSYCYEYEPIAPEKNAAEYLQQEHGFKPEEVDYVIFSHAHWDHCQPPFEMFPRAKVIFGAGTANGVNGSSGAAPGYPENPDGTVFGEFFSGEFASRVRELKDADYTVQIGDFTRAYDLFKNGSCLLIDAPGHMPGNQCMLVRHVAGEWVVLGGDTAHARALIDGGKSCATWTENGETQSMHADLVAATKSMRWLENLIKKDGVIGGARLCLAHDANVSLP